MRFRMAISSDGILKRWLNDPAFGFLLVLPYTRLSQDDGWENRMDMPFARRGVDASVVDGKCCANGGQTGPTSDGVALMLSA